MIEQRMDHEKTFEINIFLFIWYPNRLLYKWAYEYKKNNRNLYELDTIWIQ